MPKRDEPETFASLATTIPNVGQRRDFLTRAEAIDRSYAARLSRQRESIDRLLDRLRAHDCSLNDSCASCVAAGAGGEYKS